MRRCVLVTLADAAHVDAAWQVFASARNDGGWIGDLVLLADDHESEGIGRREIERFERNGVTVIRCGRLFDGCSAMYPSIVFSKAYAFLPWFKRYETVVFLDADTIVRSSIHSLGKVTGFNAARAPPHGRVKHQIFDVLQPAYERARIISLDPQAYEALERDYDLNRPAFNSGVFAFSTDIIREDTFGQLVALTHRYRSIMKGDEGILNLHFYGRWKPLPLAYNTVAHGVSQWRSSDADTGVILHFLGDHKPWLAGHPLRPLWLANRDRDLARTHTARQIPVLRIAYLSVRQHFICTSHEMHTFFEYAYGQVGRFLRMRAPGVYRALKRVL